MRTAATAWGLLLYLRAQVGRICILHAREKGRIGIFVSALSAAIICDSLNL